MAYSKKKLERLAEQDKERKRLQKEARKSRKELSEKKDKENQAIQKAKNDSVESNKKVQKKSNKRYVALRNVDKMKSEGWKEVKVAKDKHDRVLGVKVNAPDLILMEK